MTCAEYSESDRRNVLVACCFAAFIAPLLGTMMNLSLVSIGQEFGVGSHALAYVNTSFLLSSVIFMVPMTRIGDIFGKRAIFLAGVALTALASFLAAFSPDFWFLIGCRVLMGVGSAAVMTTSISMITDVFPSVRRGAAIGIQTMCSYVGFAAGPPLGGAMNDIFGWGSLFLLIVPISLLAVASMSLFKGEIRPDEGGSFDHKGSLFYGVGMMLGMLGMVNLPEPWAAVSLVAGLAVLVVFVRWQLSCASPVLNVRLFRGRVFSGSCLAAFLNYMASCSLSYFLALYLQSIGGLSSMEAGLLMIIQPAVQAVGTPYFGRISDRMGDKRILPTAGMLITAAGISTVMLYDTAPSFPLTVLTMILVGLGLSVFCAPVMRQTGMMVSMGIAMLFISMIMGSADDIVPGTYGSFIEVLRCSFAVCTVACILGAAVSMMRGRGSAEANSF